MRWGTCGEPVPVCSDNSWGNCIISIDAGIYSWHQCVYLPECPCYYSHLIIPAIWKLSCGFGQSEVSSPLSSLSCHFSSCREYCVPSSFESSPSLRRLLRLLVEFCTEPPFGHKLHVYEQYTDVYISPGWLSEKKTQLL